jgi:hypothetical protein
MVVAGRAENHFTLGNVLLMGDFLEWDVQVGLGR